MRDFQKRIRENGHRRLISQQRSARGREEGITYSTFPPPVDSAHLL
jgi:hypothetical protein